MLGIHIKHADWFVELINYQKLKVLDLSSCFDVTTPVEERMNVLNDIIGGCQTLTRLNVSSNQLERLPDNIRTLSALEYLNCSHNDISGKICVVE